MSRGVTDEALGAHLASRTKSADTEHKVGHVDAARSNESNFHLLLFRDSNRWWLRRIVVRMLGAGQLDALLHSLRGSIPERAIHDAQRADFSLAANASG